MAQKLYLDQPLSDEFVDPSKDDFLGFFRKQFTKESKHYGVKRRKFALSEEQRNEILQKAFQSNICHYLMMRTQLECGFRVSEVTNMIISQLNFGSKYPSIIIQKRETTKYHKAYSPKSKSGNREVYISQDLANSIKLSLNDRKTGYVFVSNKGYTYAGGKLVETKPFSVPSVRTFINRYAKQCPSIGRTIGSHALRRTFASYQLKAGKDLGALSKDLGHKDLKTTMIYLFEIEDFEEKIRTAELAQGMHDVKDPTALRERLKRQASRQTRRMKESEEQQ